MQTTTIQRSEVEALLYRAATGLLGNLAFEAERKHDTYDFWQGYAKALRDLQRGAGQGLADKDAALGGYQGGGIFRAAARVLGNDLYDLPRAEVAQRIANAGIKFSLHAVSDCDEAAALVVIDGAVAAIDLHDEHPISLVDADDSSLDQHAFSPVDAAIVAQGGAA